MNYPVKCNFCGATTIFTEVIHDAINHYEVEVSPWKLDPKLEYLLIEHCNHTDVQVLFELLPTV